MARASTTPDASGPPAVRLGCAGWNVPRESQEHFPGEGSHLERYASRLPAVEINSSFYRPHRPTTYARWAASVPPAFRFAVKVPRAITHEHRLADAGPLLDELLEQVGALGERLGCLLVQLPPSLEFDPDTAASFFAALRERHAGGVAHEPRHPSWFAAEAERLLHDFRVARVAADPARVPAAGAPGGWPGLVYFRLHGSPRTYYSSYDEPYLDALAARLASLAGSGPPVWCIFDNTALGAATANALGVLRRLSGRPADATGGERTPLDA